MKPTSLFLILLLSIIISGCGVKAVLFGEHKPNNNQNYYSVFIDQHGDYYPEKQIQNQKLKSAGSNLCSLYKKSIPLFYTQFSDLNLDITQTVPFDKFQEELIKYHGNEINKRMLNQKTTSITFILVGYNNKYGAATKKLDILKNKIYSLLHEHSKKTLIVELYWDGKLSKIGIDAISIFDNAQANSYYAGIQLRLLINHIKDAKTIYFVSHSLGANIVTECLFNQIKKVQDDSRYGNYSVKLRLIEKYKNSKYILDTGKTYHAAIVAPAIPGVCTFTDYAERGYTFDKKNDNYQIIGGINTYDRILNKFIKKPSLFGSTSFGCRYSEVNATFTLFEKDYDRKRIDTIDFSTRKDKHHSLQHYMKGAEYEKILKKLYNIQ
jgi:hypothetical protein